MLVASLDSFCNKAIENLNLSLSFTVPYVLGGFWNPNQVKGLSELNQTSETDHLLILFYV